MRKISILAAIKRLKRPVFTTREAAACSGGSTSNAIQSLNRLASNGVVIKISRGIWALDMGEERVSQYSVIPFLLPVNRVYVSFISALHLHGIIEQIPRAVTLASTAHTRVIKTALGVFYVHRIAAEVFKGFDWYKGDGGFLIAAPEKALIDCLYLSARKKKQFSFFPELHFSRAFSFKKCRDWANDIPDRRIRVSVMRKLEAIRDKAGREREE